MDEFARVLERFGIVLNQQELDELQKRTEEEHAAAELNVPARKKRDAIFSSYEAQDEKAILAANMKADKMRRGIRYEDFVKHFGSVLQPSQTDHDGSDFHNQDRNQGEHKKRVGHKASHKIFGSKTTSTEGKIAQKQLAKRLFSLNLACTVLRAMHFTLKNALYRKQKAPVALGPAGKKRKCFVSCRVIFSHFVFRVVSCRVTFSA